MPLRLAAADILARPAKLRRHALRVLAALVVLASVCSPARGSDRAAPLIVEDIECRGNDTTSCGFIRGHLFLDAGAPLDENEIGNASLRLSWLPNFTSVAIRLEKGSQKGRVLIVIQVAEADPIATAFSAGMSLRHGSESATASARIGNHNFLGAGKSLDLILLAERPTSGTQARESLARIQYTDPQPFGSSQNFLVVGAYDLDSVYRYSNGDSYMSRGSGVDVSIGWHMARFSYLTIGYAHLFQSSFSKLNLTSDGRLSRHFDSPQDVALLGFGWNSQDDADFPTRGGRLSLYTAVGQSVIAPFFGGSEFRYTWRSSPRSFLTLGLRLQSVMRERASIERDPLLGLTYSHDLQLDGLFEGARRARWYVEPGVTPAGYSADGRRLWEVGAKAGLLLQTRSFGLVNIYVIGTGLARTGDRSD